MDEYGRYGDDSLEAMAAGLDEQVRVFEAHPDKDVRRGVLTLLERVDALHRAGLTRLILALRDAGAGEAVARAQEEPAVRMLLELYDLLPGEDPAPVEVALDGVRPQLAARGTRVHLVGMRDGALRLRLLEDTPHDTAALSTLRDTIVATLREHFPALLRVQFEGDLTPSPANFIPLTAIGGLSGPGAGSWHTAATLEDVPPGSLRGIVVDARRLLVCNLGEAVAVVADACPGSLLPLSAGILDGAELCCPWHGCRFDARTGRRRAGVGPDLETFPVAVGDAAVRVRLPAAPPRAGGTG